MDYQHYINLGFEREDFNDNVQFKQTGYHGFVLSKDLNERISVQVCYPELSKPKMYLKKRDGETFHIINLTCDMVMDLFTTKHLIK